MNNYDFWENYLQKLKENIKNIEKKVLNVDLHIHSYKSTDADYALEEILNNTKNLDIISITDHDNLDIYDELYSYLKTKQIEKPLIIPGIEFTIDNQEYGSQSHILQYFINPKNEEILKNVNKNINSCFERTKKQFQRLKYNKAINYFIKDKNIVFDYQEYIDSLDNELPDYASLSIYILEKLLDNNITVIDIFKLSKYFNEFDKCEFRKELTEKRFIYLENKYKDNPNSDTSARLLLSILGPRGVDDDFFPNDEKTGSISVNSYGQIKFDELNKKYPTVIAHPNQNKLSVVKKMISNNSKIIGLEDNIKNKYIDRNKLYELKNLIITKGSDIHTFDKNQYENLDFYQMTKKDIEKLL